VIPVKQTIMHDPKNGKYGDCQRACMASILEMPIEEVTHFAENDASPDEFEERIDRFLAPLGLIHIKLWASKWDESKPDTYHMIYGETIRGTYHAVVGLNGVMVHDPHPSNAGLLESKRGEWVHAFMAKTFDGRFKQPLDTVT